MRLKTEYTYESEGSDISVTIETDAYTEYGAPKCLDIQAILGHIESIYKITGCPKAPTDKELNDMEEYFNE